MSCAVQSSLAPWKHALTKRFSVTPLGVARPIKQFQFKWISKQNDVLRFGPRFFSSQPLEDITLKTWSKPMIESNGDYRDEMFLEEYIGGPLYENQKCLPKLPIPSISNTLERFLPTALPLAKSKEEEMGLRAACKAFPDQAEILQERLIDRQQNEMKDTSWLQLWWNQLAYLQFRDSVVVNVSYFFHFEDDPSIQTNVQRAAAILFATAEFRKLVCSGKLQPEKVGKKQIPLCSAAYKYMFNACRIPRAVQDSYRIYDPSLHTHAIVARKGHFFTIELVDQSGDPLPVVIIEEQVKECIVVADAIPSSRPKLGLLTASNRDNWTDARKKLLSVGGGEMEEALERLESGAILVNLDDDKPVAKQDCGEIFLSGGLKNGENRWFDKSIQIMVEENGKSAFLGEHSMSDGMPMVNYANYISSLTYADLKEQSAFGVRDVPKVKDIFGAVVDKIDEKILEDLEVQARKEFESHIEKESNAIQSFQGYGSDFIKKAGHSPDAFIQMAIQLATYRLFEEQVGTYEATQVRPFLNGRTETTRAVSLESEAFVKKMGLRPKHDEGITKVREEKLDLLQKATIAHVNYIGLAAQAEGVDRHFFGLSMLVEEGEESPDLFSDPVFNRSKRWRVSTSHLTHPRIANWGFGEVVPDGVGIGYSIHPRSCMFNINALRETGWSLKLSELLEEALLEMQRLVELDQTPTSKV